MSLRSLRRHAEANLCEDCFKKYVAFIEPSIKRFLFKPLEDWRRIESLVTKLVMKHKGVFKGDLIFESLGKDADQFADEVDVKAFQEIEYWKVSKKIRYLYENGILQRHSYQFLDRARKIRNRIHVLYDEYSEDDLALISSACAITYQIFNATIFDFGEDVSENMKSNAEKAAEYWLSKINGA